MDLKGYFIFRGNIYSASDVMEALLRNPRIKVTLTRDNDLIIAGEKIRKINEPLENIISNLLCYKSLAYCCALDKPCANRDLALELLGISKSEYTELKEELDRKILQNTGTERYYNYQEEAPVFEETYTNNPTSLEATNISSLFEPTSPFKSADNDLNDKKTQLFNFFENFDSENTSKNDGRDICPNCGIKTGRYAKFCPNCGEPLTKRKKYY
ncbi:MAG: zinc-ribbon domain-containing protein [Candidatus Odinarchaeia archaeon]